MAAPQAPGGSPGQVVPFPARGADQVGFERPELMRILDLYGRMVAAGEWRDYAMDFTRHAATFAAFRRAARQAGDVDAVRRTRAGAQARA
jgi:hypothetical protein